MALLDAWGRYGMQATSVVVPHTLGAALMRWQCVHGCGGGLCGAVISHRGRPSFVELA